MLHKLISIMNHYEGSSRSKFFKRIFEEQAIVFVIIGKQNIYGCVVHLCRQV